MNNYRNEILNEFIDRYEKSSYYKGKSEKPRKISIVLHKKFPEYGHSFHYEETNELENIAFQLQSQGFVEFSKKSILGDRELILNQEENCLDRIYKELKRVPVKEKIIHYVKLLDQYHEEAFKNIPDKYKDNKLVVPLGKDVNGQVIYAELNKMPHLLIAGATGSGKSVCVNTIISSILMRAKPDEVKLILVDPKKVELSNYNGVPHLLAPVVTDPKKAAATLRETVSEMERRYDLFAGANVRKIETYNQYVEKKNQENDAEHQLEKLPYIVVILDEVADLMMVASKDVEDCIMRIAQLARAAGIHLIVATQRPSTDIITGVIKANIPSRIAFAVSSSIDSRTILDCTGAEKLLGKGDMLFLPMGSNSPIRVQGAYVDDSEVEAITYYTTKQQEASYDERYTNVKPISAVAASKEEQEDEEYEMCRAFVIQAQKASTSLLQRQFRIGYNKAARIIDQLEADGIIGPQIGSKPREVYVRGYNEEEI